MATHSSTKQADLAALVPKIGAFATSLTDQEREFLADALKGGVSNPDALFANSKGLDEFIKNASGQGGTPDPYIISIIILTIRVRC